MTTAKNAARAAQDSTVFRVVARIGYVVLGVVHLVIGGIAISVTTGSGGEADQSGAMERIHDTPAGVFLLWAIAVGLVALAAWQIGEALEEHDPDDKKKWGHRIKYVGTAIAYLAIAWSAVAAALGSGSDSSQSSQSFSAQLMATPGGSLLLAVVGLIVLAIGVAFVVRGATRAFEKHMQLPANAARKGIVTFGVVGYIAKGIAVGVTGLLFIVAAFTNDPETAGGIGCRPARARATAARVGDPLGGWRRPHDLRRLLLRPRPLLPHVRIARSGR